MEIRNMTAAIALLLGLALPVSTVRAAGQPAAGTAAQPASAGATPAMSRTWHGSDYEQVVGRISRGEISLPRLSSPASAELFARLVAEDNLSLQKDKSLPLGGRMEDFLQTTTAVSTLLTLYLRELPRDSGAAAELASVLAFMVRVAASGSDLMAELPPAVVQDETYAASMEQFRSGLTDILIGAEASLGETLFKPSQKSQVLDAMADSIESINPYLAPDVRRELAGKLAQRRAGASAEDAQAIDRLVQSLER